MAARRPLDYGWMAAAVRPRLPRAVSAWLDLPWRERWRWLGRKVGELVRGGNRIDSPDRVILERRVLPAFAADPSLAVAALRRLRALHAPLHGDVRAGERALPHPRHRPAPRPLRQRRPPRRAAAGRRRSTSPRRSVDAVVCNGVYGFGIYDRDELAKALRASCTVLRPGGTFVLGWNDVAAFAPFDPLEVALAAGFVRDATLLGAWRVTTDTPTRHTFDTLRRPHGGLSRRPARAGSLIRRPESARRPPATPSPPSRSARASRRAATASRPSRPSARSARTSA